MRNTATRKLFWRARVVWDVSNFDLKQRCVFGRAFNLGIDQATIHIRTKQQSSHSIDQGLLQLIRWLLDPTIH